MIAPRLVLALACVGVFEADAPTPRESTPQAPVQGTRYGLGRPATAQEIAAWDIDVNPAGEGLPAVSATSIDGAKLWAAKCAACHGEHGEGNERYPRLVGRDPETGFPFGRQLKYVRTVGNYWPYATTLYDYIHRAMPPTAPGSLTPDEIYGAVAWLLAANRIVPPDAVIDSRSLPRVRMPARDRFVDDDRTGGKEFR
ncbi:MAG TPA: cytochrome c [Gemmatimonadales bacterium]|nr:cytochrome c [Gemmatimonadales bacterium]